MSEFCELQGNQECSRCGEGKYGRDYGRHITSKKAERNRTFVEMDGGNEGKIELLESREVKKGGEEKQIVLNEKRGPGRKGIKGGITTNTMRTTKGLQA